MDLPEYSQHTLAVATICLANVILESFDEKMPKRLCRVQAWVEQCAIQTRARKHPSASARRAWNYFAEAIDRRGIKKDMDEAEAKARWAALVWTVHTFIGDVMRLCPLYAAGPQKRAWRYLGQHFAKLAAEQLGLYSEAEAIGLGIYEEAAWALEGEAFVSPMLEAA